MERMQKNNKKEPWQCVLHMWEAGPFRIELAHRTSMAKGGSWSVSEIRFKGVTTTMLSLQYKSRGQRSRFLPEDITGKRTRLGRTARKRSTSHRKGVRSLR